MTHIVPGGGKFHLKMNMIAQENMPFAYHA